MNVKAIIYKREDYYNDVTAHEVVFNGTNKFSVYNFSECPEDAIIGRGLFDGYDYINAVKYGMDLAKAGYMDIEVETKLMDEF